MPLDILRVVDFTKSESEEIDNIAALLGVSREVAVRMAVKSEVSEIFSKDSGK